MIVAELPSDHSTPPQRTAVDFVTTSPGCWTRCSPPRACNGVHHASLGMNVANRRIGCRFCPESPTSCFYAGCAAAAHSLPVGGTQHLALGRFIKRGRARGARFAARHAACARDNWPRFRPSQRARQWKRRPEGLSRPAGACPQALPRTCCPCLL